MRLGVIGLGNIGGAVAANLVQDGHDVAVCDVDPSRLRSLAESGARPLAGPAELAAHGEVTFSSLPTPAAVGEVAEAWLAGAPRGRVLVDLSTNAPAGARALAARLADAGCHLLEAPLTGGAPGARARRLVFMVGGDAPVVERCRPLLESLGRAVFHVGGHGQGSAAKLVNSLLAFATTWVSLEGLALAARAGIDLRTMVEIVRAGGAGNFFVDRMVEGINQRGRPAQFALALAAKDAGLIVDAAREVGSAAPVAERMREVLAGAVDAGLGDRDWSDLVEWAERLCGASLTLPPPREPS